MYYYLLTVLQLCLARPVMLPTTQPPSGKQCLKSSQWEQEEENTLHQGHAAWE